MATADSARAASNADLQSRKEAAVPRGIGVMTQIFAQHAHNAELWDVEGRRYIDFGGGIAVLNVGHRHPKVVAGVAEQLERFTHTMFQIVPYELYVSLAEKLNQLTPGTHRKKTALFSTGAEAIENAIKIARAATGRSGVIAFGDQQGTQHGEGFQRHALHLQQRARRGGEHVHLGGGGHQQAALDAVVGEPGLGLRGITFIDEYVLARERDRLVKPRPPR